jgi:transcription elongation factor Elf1
VEVDLFATARKEKPMPPEFYITCPKCGHRYNVHKMIYDEGEDFSMFCPVCTARYPRKEGKIDAANFDIKK